MARPTVNMANARVLYWAGGDMWRAAGRVRGAAGYLVLGAEPLDLGCDQREVVHRQRREHVVLNLQQHTGTVVT